VPVAPWLWWNWCLKWSCERKRNSPCQNVELTRTLDCEKITSAPRIERSRRYFRHHFLRIGCWGISSFHFWHVISGVTWCDSKYADHQVLMRSWQMKIWNYHWWFEVSRVRL
jgi:hypothetical protein